MLSKHHHLFHHKRFVRVLFRLQKISLKKINKQMTQQPVMMHVHVLEVNTLLCFMVIVEYYNIIIMI